MKVCSITGCGRAHLSRGWCSLHYQRWQRLGDPVAPGRRWGPTTLEGVLAAIDTSGGPAACHPWMGRTSKHGYAAAWLDGKGQGVHRWLWKALRGPLTRFEVLDHTCHDPRTCAGGPTCPHRRCLNLSHLAVTTDEGNLRSGRTSLTNFSGRCPQGHDLTLPGSVYLHKRKNRPNPARECAECCNQRAAFNADRKRAVG